jgi:Cellulose binding domain/Fibronectin type III domain
VATQVTETSATFTWPASAGPVAYYTIQLNDPSPAAYHDIGTSSTTTFTHTGLSPDTVYVYRVIANPASGSGYTASNPSVSLYVRTVPHGDTVPPSKPGTPTASVSSPWTGSVSTTGSTDNNRVDGYWVQRQVNGVWTDWVSSSYGGIFLQQLTPNTTYTVVVVAFDASGNRSARSDPVTFTTPPLAPTPNCRALRSQVGTQQYNVNVTIENWTTAVLANWRVTFTLPATHTVLYAPNGTLTRTGDTATFTPAANIAQINPGPQTATFGVIASRPVGSPLASNFILSSPTTGSVACTVI